MALKHKDIERLFRVTDGKKFRLKNHDPAWSLEKEFKGVSKDKLKKLSKKFLEDNLQRLAKAQDLLWAGDVYSILLVFQAMDAAGKDGTIKHVMSGVNPQGCQVFSFKQPSAEELDHNFLWRYYKSLPERGRIGIFNRSYYEEVLVVRVHPEWLIRQKLPPGKHDREFWQKRYDDINCFEQHLARNGTIILKFFLNVSKEEQKRRFLERLEIPEKQWKFSMADLAERAFWDDYMKAFEEAIGATSKPWAPWYIIPADFKPFSRALVAEIVTHAIERLGLKYPKIDEKQKQALAEAKKKLLSEKS